MNEDFPRILMTRRVEKDGAKYFGPYTSAYAVRETIDLVKKLFPVKHAAKCFQEISEKGGRALTIIYISALAPAREM